jgi:hypothetical protein
VTTAWANSSTFLKIISCPPPNIWVCPSNAPPPTPILRPGAATVWDSFEAAVHSNSTFGKLQKFSYLKAQLVGDASRAIAVFPLTNHNYTKAIQLLKERFGNPTKVINAHMQSLPDLQNPNYELASFQLFYDTMENHIMGLELLGKSHSNHGDLLVPIVLGKLPHQLGTTAQPIKTRLICSACTKTRNTNPEQPGTPPEQHGTARNTSGTARNTSGTARNTPEHLRNSTEQHGTARNTSGTARNSPEHLQNCTEHLRNSTEHLRNSPEHHRSSQDTTGITRNSPEHIRNIFETYWNTSKHSGTV